MKYIERFEELQDDEELADDALFNILTEEFPRRNRDNIWTDIQNKRKTHYRWQGTNPIHS